MARRREKAPDPGTPEVTNLEEQNVELPARHQQPVVGLQPLHLGGAAHGALAMTTPGDTSMASVNEVEAIMGGAGARVKR